MSDPQDLLYTNQFISTETISQKELDENTKYYSRYNKYINENTSGEADEYIKNDDSERDLYNLNKISNQPWPIAGNRNHYPMFDKFANDMSSGRYKKEVTTKINIDSRNRDYSSYLDPNNFKLPLNKKFTGVKKIVINDIIFPNIINSITNFSNNLAWQFAAGLYLSINNFDNNIIPVPDNLRKIIYSSIQYATYTNYNLNLNEINNNLVYQTSMFPSFYTVNDFVNTLRTITSQAGHGDNGTNYKIAEEPYYSFNLLQGNPNLFTTSINPVKNIVKIVNRIEEIKIIAMQTFEQYENDFKTNDIFYKFSDLYKNDPEATLDPSYIYITLTLINGITQQYYPNPANLISPSPFPLVITGLDFSIGNIDPELINYTEFYDLTLYTNNNLYNEDELSSVSTYKFIDTITITSESSDITRTYLRFAFKLSSGNISGLNYNSAGDTVVPVITQNVILNNLLNVYFVNSFFDFEYKANSPLLIGRALLFRWIYDKDNAGNYINYEISTENVKKRSILNYLGWPIANSTTGSLVFSYNGGFRFVHTNIQDRKFNGNITNTFSTDIKNIAVNYSKLNLQLYNNQHYFVTESYIFLKISFDINDTIISRENIINAIDTAQLQYNQNYVEEPYFNVSIGNDYKCIPNYEIYKLHSKDQDNIFVKILLSNIPGEIDIGTSNVILDNCFYETYDYLFDSITSINISVYDYSLKLVDLNQDFSFTMTIHEIQDKLKETLINTKTNSVNSNGNFI